MHEAFGLQFGWTFQGSLLLLYGDDNTVGDSKSIAPAVRHVISLVSARAGQREGWDSKCRYLRLLLFSFGSISRKS